MADVFGVGEPHDPLHQFLAAVVGGMRLAGDHELDRTLRVQQQPGEPLGVGQHQRQALVGRHAPGEADRQHVGIEDVVDPAELGRRRAPLQPRDAQPAADLVHQLRAQLAAQGEQLLVGESRPRGGSRRRGVDRRSARPRIGRETHVEACTPLVIEPIGTSLASKPGQSSLNISAATLPCSMLTPLARCASRRPMWAMLKIVGSSSAPKARMRESGRSFRPA